MREKKRGKRLLALLLACTLLATSIPVQAAPVNAPEMAGREEGAEGLEVPAGTEDPAGNTEGAEVPAEPELILRNLEGTVVLTEGGAVLEGIPDIWIRFYEQETFDPKSRENIVLAEAITEPDGSFEFPELPEGVYRVAFQFLDPEQKAEDYQVIQPEEENGEEPKYQFAFPEEEEKEVLDCFAYIESYVVEEGSSLELKLEKKEAEITPEADPEVTPEAAPETSPEVTPETTPEATPEITPETTPEAEPETAPEAEAEEDLSGVMKIAELETLGETEVGAAFEILPVGSLFQTEGAEGNRWSFHAYYVNQSDNYYVEKRNDFNLKYQMEFHTDQNLEAGDVTIRIPRALYIYRSGEQVLPSDIAVPRVDGPDESISSKSTPFNYYIDGQELVFFNYKKITAGSNAAWQVLYKDIKVMQTKDQKKWSVTPEVEVTIRPPEGDTEGKPETETQKTEALRGLVDTYVNLTSVSKTPYHQSGKSYTPGLYTEKQVGRYISGGLPAEYSGENFKKYRFVVWEVAIRGNGTQPWSLSVKDTARVQNNLKTAGKLVGRSEIDRSWAQIVTNSSSSSWTERFYVVAAYPKTAVDPGTVLENTIEVELTPADGIDPKQTGQDSAEWSWADYHWAYPPGELIGINKTGSGSYDGWLEVFKYARQNKEDFGDFKFSTQSEFRGYKLTHTIENEEDRPVGTYLDGTSYKLTTVDDFMYAMPSAGEGTAGIMLDDSDYYFTSVSIRQDDVGYDVWEDETSAPEQGEGIDQSTYIYAMYEGSREWELVEEIPWNSSGDASYRFTGEELAKHPWKVKVEHETINYRTTCDIDVTVRLRHDSETLGRIMEDYEAGNVVSMRLEDISGIIGASYKEKGVFDQYWHYQTLGNENYNYDEPGLLDATKELYKREDNQEGLILQRDNAFQTVYNLRKEADSSKTAKSRNDPNNSRVLVDYTLTAYDGYKIYGLEGVNYLKQSGVHSPGRNDVVFYDLLPYGMRFDPSQEVRAGRITSLSGSYQSQPGSWDKSQVKVTVDSEKDIIENYRGTGRTMVIFHIHYDGADAAVYTSQKWMEGWGVSFQAYYDWKDLGVAQEGSNISAFMPEDAADHPMYLQPLYGEDGEVYRDDGTVPSEEYAPFNGGDLNKDGITDIANVLYAKARTSEDVALASESKITKLVRADSDRFGVYGSSAVVAPGGGYTYDLTVSNADNKPLKDIVVFDRLEHAAEDRTDTNDPMYPFADGSWHGTFQSVVTEGLREEGIAPVIWYNERRDAPFPEGNQKPADVLTAENGWYRAENFNAGSSQVKSVAVDLSQTASGGAFALGSLKSVTFQIKMEAPKETEVTYAYNNPSFYSFHTGSNTAKWVEGNAARVSLGEEKNLEVIKEFSGEIPDRVKDTRFSFFLYQKEGEEKIPFANQEYTLWKKEGDTWVQQADRLYATDGSGYLELYAGEKAVFENLPDPARIQIDETESPFWSVTKEDTMKPDSKDRVVVIKNKYRPVLYVQKKLQGIPSGVNVSKAEFTFQVFTREEDGEEWIPFASRDIWYVDSIRTDGGIPGLKKKAKTDGEGKFTIKQGDIIALPLGRPGISYKLSEVDGFGDGTDWICKSDTVTGTVPVLGTSATITNYYRWKDILLTKSLTHQDPAECEQEFTFRITKTEKDGTETPVTGNRWVVLNAYGGETGTEGTLDEDGTFTCACAGRKVKIQGLEAEQSYTVTETESGEFYRPVNDSVGLDMPLYSSGKEGKITNDYLKRPLEVGKTVVYDRENQEEAEKVKGKAFLMTVKVDGELLKNYPYTLKENGIAAGTGQTDANGQFQLKDGQKAVFKDVGVVGTPFEVEETQDADYPQIYPAETKPHTGTLGNEGSSVSFVNGTANSLVITKEYEGADETANEYIELMKDTQKLEGQMLRSEAAVSLHMEVTREGQQRPSVWPDDFYNMATVTVVDTLTGKTYTKYWNERKNFTLKPWETLIIPRDPWLANKGIETYTVTESTEDQHRVFEWKDGIWLEVSQKEPEQDQGATGTLEENPVAKIINLISTVPQDGSEIEKRMAVGSEEVPVGAELVWRLEQYDGNSWIPAEGVGYLTFDDAGVTCDRTQETGSDGKIVLTKTANGYPRVKFTEETVYLNRYTGMEKGDLRLVEVLEESDPSWGMLAGYGRAEDKYAYSLNVPSEEAVAFVNANRSAAVEIEKKMEHPSDATFTMLLEQVLSTEGEPGEEGFSIVKKQPGAGLSYLVYDTSSGEQAGEGITGKKGEIYLKAGQYARLELPDNTLWTVQEEQKADHVLKNLTGTPEENVKKLGENLMLVTARAEVVLGGLEAAYMGRKITTGQKLYPEDFEVSLVYSDKTRVKLKSEEYTISPDVAGAVGPMKVEVHWLKGNQKIAVNLNVLEGIVLSGDMVNKGVIDAESKQEVVLNWGDVKIPESIIQDGKEYLVKEIANNAFSEKKITSIEMPNSITKIGISAFAKCSEIKKLVLPDRLEQIEPFAFYKCSGLTGNLVIPSSVTEIGNAAFMLTEFTSITVNKPKGSIPGESWGWYGTVTWTGTTPAALPKRKEEVS